MALRIRYSHFEYKKMFFSLTDISTMFQSYINKFLAEKFDIFVIVYLDDIFIYIESKKKEYI